MSHCSFAKKSVNIFMIPSISRIHCDFSFSEMLGYSVGSCLNEHTSIKNLFIEDISFDFFKKALNMLNISVIVSKNWNIFMRNKIILLSILNIF